MRKNNLGPIAAFLGMLLFFSCAQNQGKSEQKIEATPSWKFVKTIPLEGITPIGIAAQDNFLWLSDVNNNRVVKIDLEGQIIETINGFERPMHIAIQGDKIYIPEYTADNIKILENGVISNYELHKQTDAMSSVAIADETIAIADFYNNRIILKQGEKESIIGKEGHNDGELYYPTDVQIKDSLVYVADAYNNRVQVFDFEGKYIQMIGWNENINVATGLKVSSNQIIIADFEGNRVLVYNHEGKLLQNLTGNFNKPTDIELIDNRMYVVNYKGKSISLYNQIK